MSSSAPGFPWKQAMPAAIINAVINGWISWGQFKASGSVPLTLDSISGGSHTAVGSAVMVATALALILTLVNFAVVHRHRPVDARLQGGVVWRLAISTAFGNAFKYFGVAVVAGLLWQRFAGTVAVSPLAATMLVAVVAGVVSALLVDQVERAYRATESGPP